MDFVSITVKDAYGTEWRDTKDWVDYGVLGETYRGYNLEFKDRDNIISYAPIIYVLGELTAENDSVSHIMNMYSDLGKEPTGRCIFRGYFKVLLDQSGNARFFNMSMEEIEILKEMKVDGTI